MSTTPIVIYTGETDFDDAYEPVVAKSEWGIDTLVCLQRGAQPKLLDYIAGLAQGQMRDGYYLQTWQCDNNPVYPGVTLVYKGVFGAIPPPKASGCQVEQNITVYAQNVGQYASVRREIRYVTRQATTKYIATSRPAGPTYGVDVANPDDYLYIVSSVITGIYSDSDGSYDTFSGQNAPVDLIVATTPAKIIKSFMECEPVVGSPYFECQDRATYIFDATGAGG